MLQSGWFDLTPYRKAIHSPSPETHQRFEAEAFIYARRANRRRSAANEVRAELARDGALRFRVFARDNYTCQHCRATGAHVELTVDHVLPVSLGGTNIESNLQTLCRSCNSRKGATV